MAGSGSIRPPLSSSRADVIVGSGPEARKEWRRFARNRFDPTPNSRPFVLRPFFARSITVFGGGQGKPTSDSRNSRKEDGREDDKSVASARSNASTKSAKSAKSARSNKSARTYKSAWSNTGADWLAGFGHASPKSSGSRKSPGMSSARSSKSARDEEGQFVSAEAYGPNSEAGDEDVENIPIDETVDTYTQKSKDVVAGRSTKKRRALVGLSLVVGVVAGASLGVVVENRKELANAEVAEADYLANSKGEYFYDDECIPPQRRARNIGEDEETPFVDLKRSEEVVEAAPAKASGVQRREHIIIGPAPEGRSAHPEYYRKVRYLDRVNCDMIYLRHLESQIHFSRCHRISLVYQERLHLWQQGGNQVGSHTVLGNTRVSAFSSNELLPSSTIQLYTVNATKVPSRPRRSRILNWQRL